MQTNPSLGKAQSLPVDIVLAPSWWYKHAGITFDRDFFFHPAYRVEAEQKMEQVLYDKWGQFGLGREKDQTKPEIGAVHLRCGRHHVDQPFVLLGPQSALWRFGRWYE